MMGDTDYRSLVQNAIESIGRELKIQVDPADTKKIHLHGVVSCMRRAYYNRIEPEASNHGGFNDMRPGLLRKLQYGCDPRGFNIGDGLGLEGRADMIADDVVIIFRPIPITHITEDNYDIENPHASDVLYLNACMWMYEKESGIIVYISGDRRETMFSLTRSKRMFEETIRRTRVFSGLVGEKKTPILEPSSECFECQYYERCYTKRRNAKQLQLHEMFGLGKSKK